MIRIGCHLSSSKGFLAMGKQITELGGNTFQYFTRNPRGSRAKELDPDDIAAFLAYGAAHDITTVVAHAPYTLNPCSAQEKTREFAMMAMEDDLKRMEMTPHQLYNFHPGSHVGQGIETGIRLISDQLNALLQPGQTTTVLLETMAGKGSEVGGRFEELREILDRVTLSDHMGVCLDTCHVFDAGYDIVNDLDGVLTQFDKVIGLSKLRALHLNDSMNPLGNHKDRHQKIGQGYIGQEAFARIVRHPALRGLPMVLETPNELPGYAQKSTCCRNWPENKKKSRRLVKRQRAFFLQGNGLSRFHQQPAGHVEPLGHGFVIQRAGLHMHRDAVARPH